ncbi:unnamed protein product [Brassica oleracea var. botrytis]
MPLSLVQAASVSYLRSHSTVPTLFKPSSALLLKKSIFPDSKLTTFQRIFRSTKKASNGSARASLLETPVLWAGRVCVFYALVKAGLAGSKSNLIVSGLESGGVDVEDDGADLGFSKWIQNIKGKPGW